MEQLVRMLVLAAGLAASGTVAAIDVGQYVRKEKFESIKLSPKGDYVAATVPFEDRTALVIIRRSDNTPTARFSIGKHTYVDDFWWVNDERVVMEMTEKFGALDKPQHTGELFAINANGTKAEILIGQRVQSAGPGTKIQPKKADRVAAFLVDDLADDDRNVLVAVMPFSSDPFTRVERLDVYTGRRLQITAAPVRNAHFVTDQKGVVRFASGYGADNARKLYYRASDEAGWKLISDQKLTGRQELPLGFSADNATAYLEVEQDEGPSAIVALDIETQTRRVVLRDENVDPSRIIYRNGTSVPSSGRFGVRASVPVGATFIDGKPRSSFFNEGAPEARLYRMLEASFPGEHVRITSQTSDGGIALVQVSSDRNPGDFYLFDTVAKKADYLLSRSEWVDPASMAEMRPIELIARDGLKLHGYLTLPAGSDEKSLPLVMMPHGGPYGVQDIWDFDPEVQMLAKAGYAVLQLNYRGSGGYGRAFMEAGARQWGRAMQDDLTDATHWAVEQGIADGGRICIYGGSYGGYAALMGVAKEPDLYRCAVGYVGVYDLPTMHTAGDIQRRGSGETFLREWIGDRAELGATSPNRMADRIKAPVFLAAGGRDERAPIEHSKLMEKALRSAGVPVETLYFDTEGHGFYVEKNRIEYYTKLLGFLSRHLGGKVASTGGGQPAAAK